MSDGTHWLHSQEYMATLDEGIQLLRRRAEPDMRLGVAMFSNPFHIALGLRPSTSGLMCAASNVINRRSHPPLRRLIGDSTHLLVDRGAPQLKEIYGPEWDSLNLEVVEDTKHFTLLKLKTPN